MDFLFLKLKNLAPVWSEQTSRETWIPGSSPGGAAQIKSHKNSFSVFPSKIPFTFSPVKWSRDKYSRSSLNRVFQLFFKQNFVLKLNYSRNGIIFVEKSWKIRFTLLLFYLSLLHFIGENIKEILLGKTLKEFLCDFIQQPDQLIYCLIICLF